MDRLPDQGPGPAPAQQSGVQHPQGGRPDAGEIARSRRVHQLQGRRSSLIGSITSSGASTSHLSQQPISQRPQLQ